MSLARVSESHHFKVALLPGAAEIECLFGIVVVQEADDLTRRFQADGARFKDTRVEAQILCVAHGLGLLDVDPGAVVNGAAMNGNEAVVVGKMNKDDVYKMLDVAFDGPIGLDFNWKFVSPILKLLVKRAHPLEPLKFRFRL